MNEVEFAKQMVYFCGRKLREAFYSEIKYAKKVDKSLVTKLDIEVENYIKERILDSYPEDGFFGEETEPIESKNGRRWILDPLDGTTNFIMHIPFFNIALALEENGKTRLGVVYNPITDEMFWADESRAQLWDIPIKCREHNREVPLTGVCYENIGDVLKYLENTEGNIKIRKFGAMALEVCYVAWGKLEGVAGFKIKLGDFKAAEHILRKAGGVSRQIGNTFFAANNEKTLELLIKKAGH